MAAGENGGVAVAHAQDGMAGLSVANGNFSGAMVPVGEARTVLPTPDLSAVEAVETQTRAIGVIYPPPDIKAIVDKAANFVAKNGEPFIGKTCAQSFYVLSAPACAQLSLSFTALVLCEDSHTGSMIPDQSPL